MLTDLVLASLHHLLLFALVAMLAGQSVLLRTTPDAGTLQRLAGLDRGYGASALLLLVVGVLRVVYGTKGAEFYLHNPWFHAKVGAFVLAALVSILPTIRFLRWRKALASDSGFLPNAMEVARIGTLVRFELVLVAAIFVFAAMMARYGGF